MKAMILAAGRGERLRPLTDTTPKPLLEVQGRPLLQWHVERLRDAGFDELIVNASWLKEQLADFLGDGSRFGVRVHVSVEPSGALETAGGIVQALPLLGERFLVVNGDIFTDFDFRALSGMPPNGDLAHLVLVPNPAHHANGDFGLIDGRVHDAAGERLTFSGIGVYRRELFAACEPGVRKLAPLLRGAMRENRVSGETHAGAWSDVGTPERLAMLNARN
ncbi:MAG TPA: nucleotidyltransferase family protein [Gammaproteobacteria bacterium]